MSMKHYVVIYDAAKRYCEMCPNLYNKYRQCKLFIEAQDKHEAYHKAVYELMEQYDHYEMTDMIEVSKDEYDIMIKEEIQSLQERLKHLDEYVGSKR